MSLVLSAATPTLALLPQSLDSFLQSIPPVLVYLLAGLVVGVESIGVPVPGEITLVTAALLSAHHELDVSPFWVAFSGAVGAIVGDSIGYGVGHHYGRRLLVVLARRFPKHFSPEIIAFAEHVFHRYGMFAVFFGRFVALLRIFAGPISGVLRMPYHRFLPANALGGITWSFGMAYLVFYLGKAAEAAMKDVAWIGLGIFAAVALIGSTSLRHRIDAMVRAHAAAHPERVKEAAAQLG
ncbi:DedA family protein [Arsenicicoccus piscis]|uniref:Membrane protein n=1 Tax=Arsenicicoccus piscis TaxID=673954 RepID=A0ABQ6HQM5_9MICO|nr:DedA family protein [Arsenicicoccus piscis]MCH8628152.1 DedA family protein [Arsenicicoccus piscis]GMA20467.1 putative membrane protein [Arsenicicoccus piscis]